jgi:hypothetical protein
MKKIILAVCVCVLIASASNVALASWGNLVTNGAFTSSLSGWKTAGAVVWDGSNGQPKGSAVVPVYAWALLSQTVQVTADDWDPTMTKTQYELKAKLRIYPTEDIHFKIGWWDNVTTAPGANATPDHVLDVGHWTDTDECWKDVTYSGYLNTQPKWLSVRVEWNPELNQPADCHGWVDQIEFRAKCTGPSMPAVPEPMSMILGCLGLVTMAGARKIRAK